MSTPAFAGGPMDGDIEAPSAGTVWLPTARPLPIPDRCEDFAFAPTSGHNCGANMGFWPFGREPANVEMVSRVVTALTQNGHRVRGKLTIHFFEPQRQADADIAGDRCAALAVARIREAPDHSVIGAELTLSTDLMLRYPTDVARARAIELLALHVVGDPALSDELRRASSTSSSSLPAASQAPSSSPPAARTAPPGSMTPLAPPVARSAPPGSVTPLAPPVTSSSVPPRRRASSQIRSIQSLLMPPGTPPAAMAQFISPVVKDSAARLLIGFLRAHDLIAVRGVSIDESSGEMLASLVPVSDAPPGGYEASRAGEIARWQTTLGPGVMFALQHEVRVVSVYLAKEAMVRVEVMPALVDAVVESLSGAAFPEEAGILTDLGRFPDAVAPAFASVLAQNLTRLAETTEDPAAMAFALTPLLSLVQEDLNVAAMIIKQSSGA
ncbi:Hypothetical protein A7982_06537 [Minicystis rosea]|nr:Hypothetical protein A7982_06537 [Minicystis rosea]